ncbi:glycosyltransferase family 2 protein [Trichothermofontia sp.]
MTTTNFPSTKPLVSVIIAFLNGQNYISEAIESVIAQTYGNWEIMLVDDGSTDHSMEIALDYSRRYPEKIYYLEHPEHQNLGLGLSRNLGIRQSKGEYIAFLDADDIWLPQKLEKQLSIFQDYPKAGMVFGAHNRWYSWTGNHEDLGKDQEFLPIWGSDIQPNTLVQPPKFFIDYLYNKLGTPLTCSVLIRRQVIDEIGYFDREVSFLNEDGPFFARIYLKVPIFMENACWDRYRQHGRSITAIARERGEWFDEDVPQPVHLAEMLLIEKYLREQGVTDPKIWQAMNAQLFPYRHPNLYKGKQILKKVKNMLKQVLYRRNKKTRGKEFVKLSQLFRS